MKTIFYLSIFFVAINTTLSAQLESGFYLGVNSTQVNPSELSIDQNPISEYKLALEKSNFGFHAGLYINAQIGNIFIQPAIYLQSNSYDYSLNDLSSSENEDLIVKEKFNFIDIPVSIGYKFWICRVYLGPTVHFFVNSTSELADMEGYEDDFNPVSYAIHSGLGINLASFRVDVKWEQSLNSFGDHIVYEGNNYAFDDRPSRLYLSIGYKF